MSTAAPTKAVDKKRKYNSPLRQQQTADTKERIVAAGSELVHEFPTWDWTNLTAKAVGERAGVAERTVHRHFSSERALRHAVLQRLVEESGVNMEDFQLKEFRDMTVGMLNYLLSFSAKTNTVPALDPTLASIAEYRREQLLDAVVRETPTWGDEEQKIVAAGLDILWDPSVHERIRQSWGFDRDTATRSVTWMIDLIETAIKNGNKP